MSWSAGKKLPLPHGWTLLIESLSQLVGSMSIKCSLRVLSFVLAATPQPGTQFPPWDKSLAEKLSLGAELCHLGGGLTLVKWNCFSYPIQCVLFDFFFFLFSSVGVGPLPWTIRLPQRLCCLSRSDCLNHCSQGGGGVVPGPWPRGAGAGLQATSGSTARTEICMTVTIQMYVWLSLGPLTYGAGSRTKATWGCSWVLRGV